MADTKPGDGGADGKRLKTYWLAGPGRAKWSTAQELFNHLRKYIQPDDRAWRVTAQWYHEAVGVWPGSDANRVLHGGKPRGHVVGPG